MTWTAGSAPSAFESLAGRGRFEVVMRRGGGRVAMINCDVEMFGEGGVGILDGEVRLSTGHTSCTAGEQRL